LASAPEVFLDPNTFSTDGTVALHASLLKRWQIPGYSISRSGSDWNEIFVMDVPVNKSYPIISTGQSHLIFHGRVMGSITALMMHRTRKGVFKQE